VATRPLDVNGFGWDPPVVGSAIDELCRRFTVLSEGPELLQRWRGLVEAKRVRGKNAHDARLAAIALVHGVADILTLNVADFARFDGVGAVHPSSIA